MMLRRPNGEKITEMDSVPETTMSFLHFTDFHTSLVGLLELSVIGLNADLIAVGVQSRLMKHPASSSLEGRHVTSWPRP